MKPIIVLVLLFSLLTSCNQASVKSPSADPSETHVVRSTLQTPATPLVVSTTATWFTDQISIEHAQVLYYDITGSTARELRAAMDELGPRDTSDGNKPVDAFMDWSIRWNWPGYGTETCDLSGASVTYSIKVIMPRWEIPAKKASPELVSTWDNYMNTLVLHEQGHVNIIVDYYLTIKSAIQNATCSTAEAAAHKALSALCELNSNYDMETKHGETQGAVFP